eukprot:6175192-Pleurochrysis_carterae.AAC.1
MPASLRQNRSPFPEARQYSKRVEVGTCGSLNGCGSLTTSPRLRRRPRRAWCELHMRIQGEACVAL